MTISAAALLVVALFGVPHQNLGGGGRRVAIQPGSGGAGGRVAEGQFLVASRTLVDPSFAETVVLMLAYDDRHALGLVINRPTRMRLAAVLPNVEALRGRDDRLHLGGPVARDVVLLLIRAAKASAKAEPVFGHVYLSGSMETLRTMLARHGQDDRFRAFAGYAGWGPGQLDGEIARGDWYVMPADAAALFDVASEDVWRTLVDRAAGRWTDRRPVTEDRRAVRRTLNAEP